jgi:class 3 adenylate cyclase
MDVAAWLSGLGLEQYVELFRENDIDGEILCGMTAEDLKELGISSFGHRRRLLNAIAALGGEPPTRYVAQSAAGSTSAPTSASTIDAERRQLTVMFCDLVGSTALSTRFDPEDLRELIGGYHRAVADTVGHFDGFVAKYMGDGVLVATPALGLRKSPQTSRRSVPSTDRTWSRSTNQRGQTSQALRPDRVTILPPENRGDECDGCFKVRLGNQ